MLLTSPRSFLPHSHVGMGVTLDDKSMDMVSNLDFCSSYYTTQGGPGDCKHLVDQNKPVKSVQSEIR